VSASGEVRLVPVSREQRDWHAKQAISLRGQVEWFTTHLDGDGATAASREAKQHEALVAAWDAAAGGEAAAERSLSSRGDAVWTVDDLPHLLDEQVERPSVSLRETIEAHDNRVRAYMEEHGWRRAINRMYWTHDDVRPLTFPFRDAIVKQVEREAEEDARDA
jgi:hypothetical protein